ncbi:MAG: UDP-N-acetylmuramate--L-alanine ligase [Candidatus Omnitrophica bacterium]|nr:UDP-N-acetylmuramate--L-alanine ligase [Candidatus Omnitrophota bacterium]
MFKGKEKVHLVGIGGIGMSGIAQLLLDMGCEISGSDLKDSALIEKMRHRGAKIHIGHKASNLADAQLVIFTPALENGNPEIKLARAKGIPALSRAQALAELANQKKTIAVTGAHGKTTTSSLISHMLVNCGLKPTICVGGELFSLDGNAFSGSGNYFVLEADESDGSFLTLNPFYSVITNIDREHLDYYRDFEHIIDTFRKFMQNTREEGALFCCKDDSQLMHIAGNLERKIVSFGLSAQADVFAQDVVLEEDTSDFECISAGRQAGRVTLHIPGRHNVSNALAAIAVGLEMGIDFDDIRKALMSYKGVRRRMELKLRQNDIMIFEDYAHHPTEIKVTLDAFKNYKHKRILAVFQPHRYTRTKFLLDDFATCFQGVDHLIVTDIYAASEPAIEGVDAAKICEKARLVGVKNARFLPKYDILQSLIQEIKPGDLVAIMGAGDIGSLASVLAEEVKKTLAL